MPRLTSSPSRAPGAPGQKPRWTHSTKNGLGTAYHTACNLWFTLSHGVVNELYYPTIDQPNTRDFQLLVTDGETFCHEEKSDLHHELSYPERGAPLYRLVNTDPAKRYRIIKEVCTDPHRPVLLVRVRLEVLDRKLHGKLRVYAMLAPHLGRGGAENSAWACEFAGRRLFHAARRDTHLSFACDPDFSRRSVGFAGKSDGWRDLTKKFALVHEHRAAENGNVALTAELDPSRSEWTLAVGFGNSAQSAATTVLQTLAEPFATHREGFVAQWKRAEAGEEWDFSKHTGDGGGLYRLSRCLLLAHEDKLYQGAMIASLSIPWGEARGDDELGGYHLVWTRDLVQSATALLASGQAETPLRALIWLACIQKADGSFPQNSWIDGRGYWDALQIDQIAAPILLAWRLRRDKALQLFDPWPMLRAAARYLLLQGPVTAQERWEEQSGYSPSTIGTVIAGLACAAEFARDRGEKEDAALFLSYADWLASHLNEWCVTTRGELVPGRPRHFVRITPADPDEPDPHPDPDTLDIQLANGGGRHPARNVVSGDFIALVRLGIRAWDDPLVVDSLAVIDAVLKRDLPQGPGWRRYNHDGYGQNPDGSAFDGAGRGGCWPLLTGERGQYALIAGEDPLPYIKTMEGMANEGGMLPEQVWDEDDLPEAKMIRGEPTGSAMPLCWSHAEYVSLVRSARDGATWGRIEPAWKRYVAKPTAAREEFWTFRHQTRRLPPGRDLRLLVAAAATVVWTSDGWKTLAKLETTPSGLPDLHAATIPARGLPPGARIEWTFHWHRPAKWEGRNFAAEIAEMVMLKAAPPPPPAKAAPRRRAPARKAKKPAPHRAAS